MGVADSHLAKLDRVQLSTEALGGFKCESLSSRRDSACIAMACKLLSGGGRGTLNLHAPTTHVVSAKSRHQVGGLQVVMPFSSSKCPLECYKNSFMSKLPRIWSRVPQDLVQKCGHSNWLKLPKLVKKFKKNFNHIDVHLSNIYSINGVGT